MKEQLKTQFYRDEKDKLDKLYTTYYAHILLESNGLICVLIQNLSYFKINHFRLDNESSHFHENAYF